MSVTSGFFNSISGDRKYNAVDLSSLFDGLITDGIFATIGTSMVVVAAGGRVVNVGIGRAWFKHTWTLNSSVLPIEVPESEMLLNRIDAIILEVNNTDGVRKNDIKCVKGTPATNAVRPTMIKTDLVNQYPLCYISIPKESTAITQADITNCVGTTECPLVAGIIEGIDIDVLIPQWQDQLTQFKNNQETGFNTWMTNQQTAFNDWFDNVKTKLSGDVAANLQTQIDSLITKTDNLKNNIVQATLLSTGWVGTSAPYTQSVNITGLLSTDNIIVSMAQSVTSTQYSAGVDGQLQCTSQSDGSVVLSAFDTKPVVDIPISVLILGR